MLTAAGAESLRPEQGHTSFAVPQVRGSQYRCWVSSPEEVSGLVKFLAVLPDWATIIGAPVGIIGLIYAGISLKITKQSAIEAKNAAQSAEAISRQVEKKVEGVISLAGLSSIDEIMSSIKAVHRSGNWPLAIEKYERVKTLIYEVRASVKEDDDKSKLLGCYSQFDIMEAIVDKHLANPASVPAPDYAKFNKITSQQLEIIRIMLGETKKEAIRNE